MSPPPQSAGSACPRAAVLPRRYFAGVRALPAAELSAYVLKSADASAYGDVRLPTQAPSAPSAPLRLSAAAARPPARRMVYAAHPLERCSSACAWTSCRSKSCAGSHSHGSSRPCAGTTSSTPSGQPLSTPCRARLCRNARPRAGPLPCFDLRGSPSRSRLSAAATLARMQTMRILAVIDKGRVLFAQARESGEGSL